MRLKFSVGWFVFAIILGALIGSALGEAIGVILPAGVAKDFFLRSAGFGLSPVTLNLVLFTLTFGFTFKLNVIGVIGIFLATYIFRWYT